MNEKDFERLLVAVLVVVGVLAAVPVLRLAADKPIYPLGESYYNLRMAQLISQDWTPQDPLQSAPFEGNAFHYFVGALLRVAGIDTVATLLPFALGMCAALLLYGLLRTLGIGNETAIYSVMVLSATPSFIILFTTLNVLGLALVLSLASISLLLTPRIRILGILPLAALGYTSLPVFAATIFIALFIMRYQIKKALLLVAAPVLLYAIGAVMGLADTRHGFHPPDIALSVLGSSLGFDIFMLLLFSVGLFALWAQDKSTRIPSLIALGLVALAFINMALVAVASVIIPAYCVYGILHLHRRKWELDIIKAGTGILIACALVFSALNQISIQSGSEPDNDLRASLLSIKYSEPGLVLTAQRYTPLVNFYSGKRALLEGEADPQYSEKLEIARMVLNSSRITDAQGLLQEHRIKYILITPSMAAEEWDKREEGLLFLLHHSDNFETRYEHKGIEIWEYRP